MSRDSRHDVLVDRRKLAFIADLPPGLGDSFAGMMAEALEFNDEELMEYLEQELLFTTSVRGKRAKHLVSVLTERRRRQSQGEEGVVGGYEDEDEDDGRDAPSGRGWWR